MKYVVITTQIIDLADQLNRWADLGYAVVSIVHGGISNYSVTVIFCTEK